MLSFLKQEPGFYRMTAALAFPIIMQNLITNALGMVDTFMVGVLGERAMAAVTLANVPVFVVTLLIFGIQSGCSVLMNQYWGQGDVQAVNRVIGVGCYISGGICLLFACVMFFFPVPFIGLFSNNRDLVELAAEYARIVGFSYPYCLHRSCVSMMFMERPPYAPKDSSPALRPHEACLTFTLLFHEGLDGWTGFAIML